MPEIDSKQIARLSSLVIALQEFVDWLKGRDVSISPATAERIAKFRGESRCLFCGKPLGAGKATRGAHQVCYGKVNRRIRAGKITLQNAVDKGWINPIAELPGPKTERPDPMQLEEAEGAALASEAIAEEETPKEPPQRRKPKRRRDKSRDR